MRLRVVDASAVVEVLLRTPRGREIAGLLTGEDVDLHVPILCDVEVAAVLRRVALGRKASDGRIADALEDYLDLPLVRHPHQTLLARVLELRRNFSAYDATYVALAETLTADLLTVDRALASAVQRHMSISLATV